MSAVSAEATPNFQAQLFEAAEKGNTEIIPNLVEMEANLNFFNEDGVTPLHVAAKSGHEGVVRILIALGFDPNAIGEKGGQTVAHVAAWNGHTPVVRALEELGADLYLCFNGFRLLETVACQHPNPNPEICRFLLEKGHGLVKNDPSLPFDLSYIFNVNLRQAEIIYLWKDQWVTTIEQFRNLPFEARVPLIDSIGSRGWRDFSPVVKEIILGIAEQGANGQQNPLVPSDSSLPLVFSREGNAPADQPVPEELQSAVNRPTGFMYGAS